MRERVLEILKGIKGDIDFEKNRKKLIDDGILDSFDVISLATDLSDEFDVEISAFELELENFNSIDSIVELIKTLQNKA